MDTPIQASTAAPVSVTRVITIGRAATTAPSPAATTVVKPR